ncbi:MAG: hypothetical protein K2Q97_02365 [Burkholderiaceae bacterium]|nr:hypothetical protein [Burkholderiaceae bacterium]
MLILGVLSFFGEQRAHHGGRIDDAALIYDQALLGCVNRKGEISLENRKVYSDHIDVNFYRCAQGVI